MLRRHLTLFAAVVFWPAAANAHAFVAGQGAYESFLQGASLTVHTPEVTLAVAAFGLFVGLWKIDGLPLVWPALIGGILLGLVLSHLAPFDPMLPLYAIALGSALLAALALPYSTVGMRAFAAVSGVMIAGGAVAGHGIETLPFSAQAGVFAGINIIVAVIAGLASLPQRRIAADWPVIGLRIVASWLAAITVMMAAFALK